MNIWWIVLITFIAGVIGTGIGGVIGAVLGNGSSKIVSLLLSFAGGIMMAVVCFDLIPEAYDVANNGLNAPLLVVILGVFVGYGVIFLLNYFIDKHTSKDLDHIDENHPKTADDLDELIHYDHYDNHKKNTLSKNSKYQLFIAGVVMASAIALHNLPEGMVIGASYAGTGEQLIAGSGFIIAIVIGLHNIPEGMAVSVPLIAGGTKKIRAILTTALSGLPTVIGAVIGYSLGMISDVWLAISLSFASGAMLYVVFGELLPESILMWKSKLPALFMLIGTLLGFVLVKV